MVIWKALLSCIYSSSSFYKAENIHHLRGISPRDELVLQLEPLLNFDDIIAMRDLHYYNDDALGDDDWTNWGNNPTAFINVHHDTNHNSPTLIASIEEYNRQDYPPKPYLPISVFAIALIWILALVNTRHGTR